MKVPHGTKRPEYVRNPDNSRDPPSPEQLKKLRAFNGGSVSKIWRKAREGKL